MASSDPNKHGRIHKALGSLSGSVLAGLVTNFLQSVSTLGWATAAAALEPVTAGAVVAATTILGISHSCEGAAEKRKAAELGKEFAKLTNHQGNALDLLKKIANGEIGIELNWFGVQEVAERTTAMISSELDEQFASVLEDQQAGFATLVARLAELSKKLDQVAQVRVNASGAGSTVVGRDIVIEKAETVFIGGPPPAPKGGKGAYSTGRLFLELDGEFAAFDGDQRRILEFGLAAFLGLDPSAVRIIRVDPGSIRVTLEIPADSIPFLLEAFRLGTLGDYVKPLVVSYLSERPEPSKRRPETPGSPRRAVILTALGLEFSAVCEFLLDSVEEVGASGAVYRCGAFGKDSTAWTVLVAETGTGNVESALHAQDAISHFNPDVLLFVGVAGGLKDVKLGDVVASTKVYGYESGKQNEEFLPRPVIALPDFGLEQRARAVVRDRVWMSRISEAEERTSAYVGAIAAGEKVLASRRSDLYNFLKETYGDALAVEMEGYGFLAATRRHPGIEALVIRGISDLIHKKARADATGSQERAARYASAFAFEVLAGLAGAGSRPPRIPAPSSKASPSVKVSTGRLPATGPYLFGRNEMLTLLDKTWTDEKANVFALVAGGGVGKSALVNHWLAAMGQDDYRGARRVYGHSFYSQGTSDGTASADTFFAEALAWFGDPDPTKGSAWARGERLAELVRTERTLLILDGMEPLQRPPGPNEGHVTDPGLQALLRELAAWNPGLCVVTTRQHVADLDRFAGAVAAQKKVEDLPNEAGANLLAELGAKGPVAEMKKASKEFGNHALALTLLGTYLVRACDGDIRRRAEISLVDADKVHGGHARKVMASYEKWLIAHGREAELSIVRMLGLFNRPAEAGCVAALRGGEPIADLTVGLADMSEAERNIALANLREAGLLAEEDEQAPGALDAHPLVREHFAERLENDFPEAWRAGHVRLYEYLKGPGCKKDLPDTTEEMAPLYAAVLHGCAAGRHQEAFDDVYWRRILRGNEGYSIHKLAAFGADLGALAGLFREVWRRPVASVHERAQAFIINQAGFDLRALGRLTDAVEPMRAGLATVVANEDWRNAAGAACNLSELYLTLGRIPDAIDAAKRSVDFADRSGDIHRIGTRAALASALHQLGEWSEAETVFEEAERMQRGWEGQPPLLYSFRGYQYCDLLLARGDQHGVIERATSTIAIAERGQSLLAIALDHLSLGRAYLLVARADRTDAFKKAWAHIDLAVDGLRKAEQQDDLPRGLLARAELYLFTGDHADARAALNEAMDIATRDPAGPMMLHVTDCHLGFARLALAEKKPEVARRELAQARALIEETGYHRRDAELAELENSVKGPRDPGA